MPVSTPKIICSAISQDDVILNLMGGLIGCYLYIGLEAITKHLPKFFQKMIIINIIVIIIIIFLVLYILNTIGWKVI